MSDERMIAWLREEARLAVYLSEEEMLNEIADRIEALQAENAKLRALNQAAAECAVALMEECARYRDEIYAALQETER